MDKTATVRNTQVTPSGKTPLELAMERRPRGPMDTAFTNAEQLTSTSTKQDLLNEEIQKLAMQTHLEVQQREDIRRDLAERMKFVPPDLRVGESMSYWQEDPNKLQQRRKSGRWLQVEIIAVKGPMAVISTGASISEVNASNLKKTFGHIGSGRTSSMVKPWSLAGLSLCDCPASLSDVFLTWAPF